MAFPGRNIYPDNIEEENEELYKICSNQMDITIKSSLRKTAILITFCTAITIWSTYQTMTDEVKITVMQLKLPYVEENSYAEFIGNVLLELNVLGHGFLGYLASEVGVDIVNDFVAIAPKILKYQLKKMIQQHEKNSSADTVSALGNIVQHLRDYDKYVQI